MANQNPPPPPADDDDEGYKGPDVETVVKSKPTLDIHDDLNDSADSYISPARTDRD